MNPLTVYLADDHLVVRQGLRQMLKSLPAVLIAGEAGDGVQLLEMVRKNPPDMVLLDLKMPRMDGIEVARVLMQEHPRIGIMVVTSYDDEKYLKAAIDLGVRGYVLKDSPKEEIIAGLLAVHHGGQYYSSSIVEKLSDWRTKEAASGTVADFTPRELEVIPLVCKGYTNDRIAQVFGISKRTVEKVKENLYRKAGVNNGACLTVYAVKHGLYKVAPGDEEGAMR